MAANKVPTYERIPTRAALMVTWLQGGRPVERGLWALLSPEEEAATRAALCRLGLAVDSDRPDVRAVVDPRQ